jgi:hypothetical protein
MSLYVSTYYWHMSGTLILHRGVCLSCVGRYLPILGTCGLHYLGSSTFSILAHYSMHGPLSYSINKMEGTLANKFSL